MSSTKCHSRALSVFPDHSGQNRVLISLVLLAYVSRYFRLTKGQTQLVDRPDLVAVSSLENLCTMGKFNLG